MTPDEEWRAAPGFPDYEVSDLGRIRRATDSGKWVRLEDIALLRLEAASLRDEVERLRATLSVITATDCYSRDEVTAIARAALEGTEHHG